MIHSRLGVLFAVALMGGVAGAQDFQPLLNKVPSGANTLVVANLGKIQSSAVGVAEGVAAARERNYQSGLTAVPPDATRLVAAAQVDFELRTHLWEAVIIELADPVDISRVVKSSGGKLDTLGGVPAVILPHDAYLVQFAQNLVGAMSPANRQAVSRWAAMGSAAPITMSPYLAESAAFANNVGTEIIVAVDLNALVHPDRLKLRLPEFKCMAGMAKSDTDALAEKLATIRGVTLGIRTTTRIFGAIKVDFGEAVAPLEYPLAKQLFLEILGQSGYMLDELPEWTGKVQGNQFVFEGELSPGSVRQVMSLVDTSIARMKGAEAPKTAGGEDAGNPARSPENEAYAIQIASQQYFTNVSKLLDDFLEKKKNRQTFGQVATWMERYASKIDRLPMLNVDDELLQYGAYVSDTLRNGSGTLRGTARQTRVEKNQAIEQGTGGSYAYGGVSGYMPVYGGYRSTRYGGMPYYGTGSWWRPYGRREQQQIATSYQIQASTQSNTASQNAIQEIEEATRRVRADMTKKYKVEF